MIEPEALPRSAGTTSGPVLPDVKQHLATPVSPVTGRVVSTERCTAGRAGKAASFVRHIAIDVAGTPLAGVIIPGQSFGVIPPGLNDRGIPHKLRLYSCASPSGGEDGSGTIIATTVKRTIDEHHDTHRLFLGVASNYLCDLHPGDQVALTGPSGKRFLLPVNPAEHDYIFIATGTGIAPFRGMIIDLLRSNAASRIALIMGAAYASDLLYHADLLDLQKKHANFRYFTAVSREKQADGSGPLYAQDRFTTDRPEFEDLLQSPRTLIYICGIAGMELGVLQKLAAIVRGPALEQFLSFDAECGDPAAWTRRMIHRQVRPTRRVFIEVY